MTVVQIIPQGGMQEEIVEVTQFIPHERIAVVFPVPQFRNKLWESRSFFRRSGSAASWSRSWCATDFAENQKVIQPVRTAVEQIVAFPTPQITGKSSRCSPRREPSHDADCGLVPQITEEITESSAGTLAPMKPSMTHSSPSSRQRGAGVAGSFTPNSARVQ